jgi:hypothetical protein
VDGGQRQARLGNRVRRAGGARRNLTVPASGREGTRVRRWLSCCRSPPAWLSRRPPPRPALWTGQP